MRTYNRAVRWERMLESALREVIPTRVNNARRGFFVNLHGLTLQKKRELLVEMFRWTWPKIIPSEALHAEVTVILRELDAWLYGSATHLLRPAHAVATVLESSATPTIYKALAASLISDVHDAASFATRYMVQAVYQQHRDDIRAVVAELHWSELSTMVEMADNDWRVDRAWFTGDVVAMAACAWEKRDFTLMPILADALSDAGCDEPWLEFLRNPAVVWARGCRIIDVLTGRR